MLWEPTPLVKQQETINLMIPAFYEWESNWQTQFYEKKTNVHVNWITAPTDQFKERVNLAFASGTQLDLILGGNTGSAYNLNEVMRLSSQGLLLPIQDYMNTDTVYMKRNIDAHAGWRQFLTAPDGNIYALPMLSEALHVQYYGKMWINKEFLKNLNLKIPATLNEFHDMLLAFKNRDANGNGDPNDEIPLMSATDNFGCKIDTYLMSAFVYDDGENRLYLDDNGKVKAAFLQPEFQQGLKTLHQWYTEGLIYKDGFVSNRATRAQLNSQKYESIIGAMPNIHHGNLGTRESDQPVRWIDYEPIPPLTGPNGLRTTRNDIFNAFLPTQIHGVIPATCRNPALIMRWLDWYQTEEGTITTWWGEKGMGWEDAEPGSTGMDGSPAKYKEIVLQPDNPYYGNKSWSNHIPCYETAAFRNSLWTAPDMLAPDGSGVERFLYVKTKENYEPYGINQKNVIPPMYYSENLVSEVASLTTAINPYVEESIAKFVVGDLNVDSGWAMFQQNLKNLGVDRYLQIVQETYDKSAYSKR
jgi:putative aldouronate transport system substrate-binding protein